MVTLKKTDIEFVTSDYEEDGYLEYIRKSDTPSFDGEDHDVSDSLLTIPSSWAATNFVIAEDDDDEGSCSVETEFVHRKNLFNKKNTIKDVRVKFQDLSKPYLARITTNENYLKFLHLVKGEDSIGESLQSPDSGINEFLGLTPEEQEKQRKAWQEELTNIENEIQTLRHVLTSKTRQAHELKRKLGISVWKEIQDDMSQGIKNVKESNVYQKTESVIKPFAERTTSLIGDFGSGITMKLGQLKNSESLRSIEEKMGSAYETVKSRVIPSRSNSVQYLDEALREADINRSKSVSNTPATTPTIAE
ncbi:uncharacterized protein LOC135832601 isoform X2 [Planococcus citri]|uniref:uncharacterized protein LOC135832601 isoform X2 n=1 Tax=Planococcus citri TaxID=170843 RepID=UPI0031F96A88